jgi:predicted Rossmann-fold nucleotide-binding protein
MPSWKDRLFKLIEKGDAYIFLDGATGTLNELFVVLEMTNRGLLRKPVIILGNKLGALLRSLKKDSHFDLPRECRIVSSIPQAIKLLKR